MSATVGRTRRWKSAYAMLMVKLWAPAWNTIRSSERRPVDVDRHVVQVPERRQGPGLAIGEGGGELSLKKSESVGHSGPRTSPSLCLARRAPMMLSQPTIAIGRIAPTPRFPVNPERAYAEGRLQCWVAAVP